MSDWLTVAISLLALALSVLVYLRQRRAEGRAHFTAEWEGPEAVTYRNHGPGAARDVRAQLIDYEELPFDQRTPYIGALQSMRADVLLVVGLEQPRELRIEWNDNRRARQTLTIYLPDAPHPRPTLHPRDGLDKAVRAIARDEAEGEVREAFQRLNRGLGF